MEIFESSPQGFKNKWKRTNYLESFFYIGSFGYLSWHWVYQGIVDSSYDQLWFRFLVFCVFIFTATISYIRNWKPKKLEFHMFVMLSFVWSFDLFLMCRLNPGSIYQTFGMYILTGLMIIALREIMYVFLFSIFSMLALIISQLVFGEYLAGTLYFHIVGIGTVLFFGTFFQYHKHKEYKIHERDNYLNSRVEELSNIGGWQLNLMNGELWFSPQIQKMWSLKRSDSLITFKSKLGLENYNILIKEIKNLKEKMNSFEIECEVKENYNSNFYKITGKTFQVENGKCLSLIGTISDITEKKKLEIAIEFEKNRSLVNAKLIALGDLASSLAHQINNPLTVIFGAVKKIQKEMTLEEKKQLISRAENSVFRITQIIQKLQRVSIHQNVFTHSDVNLYEIVNENLNQLSNILNEYEIKVNFQMQSDIQLCANEQLISQVIQNLLSNSIDAIKHQTDKQINISLQRIKNKILLKIIDNGPGISEEIADKIMEPFFTTKKIGTGIGLGLSTCFSIMKHHGGNLYFERLPGQTSFVIEFQIK